ncbi:MAG: CocE/NonD family hydrolase [Gammaproteobacteria bacterium]|nr:CocE/NonD family hydrolase [Gammaproteobacteria bacterium]
MPRIHFESRTGVRLTGSIELPPGGHWKATALFAHCFTCGRNLHSARRISGALAAQGFAVLRFDFTGLGESEGEFADTNFSSNLDDLEDAAAWLAEHLAAPQLLVGTRWAGPPRWPWRSDSRASGPSRPWPRRPARSMC